MAARRLSCMLDDAWKLGRRSAAFADSRGCKIISMLLRLAESESFSEQWQSAGLTSISARRIAPSLLESDVANRRDLERITSSIGPIAESRREMRRPRVALKSWIWRAWERNGQQFALTWTAYCH
ncbi:DNA mobilization endonuclease VirD1/MobC family subunit